MSTSPSEEAISFLPLTDLGETGPQDCLVAYSLILSLLCLVLGWWSIKRTGVRPLYDPLGTERWEGSGVQGGQMPSVPLVDWGGF